TPSTTAMPASSTTINVNRLTRIIRFLISASSIRDRSVGDGERAGHIFMAAAAENGADEGELSRFIGREPHDACPARLDFGADVKIRQAESMRDIFGLNLKSHRLAFLYGDLTGHELEFLRLEVNELFDGLGACHDGDADSCPDCHSQNQQCNLLLHLSSLPALFSFLFKTTPSPRAVQ